MCRVHGKVDEKMDMRIKAIIDDGTGALTLVLNAGLTQELCGITIEKAKEITQVAMTSSAVEDEVRKKLLGRLLTARGNMSKGEFGITFVASKVEESLELTKDKADELLAEAGQHG